MKDRGDASKVVRNLKAGLRFANFLWRGTYGNQNFKSMFNTSNDNKKMLNESNSIVINNFPVPKQVPRDYEKNY